MASVALREELNCSLCLDIYTNPVMLSCGHNFCRDCIASVFDNQQEHSKAYSCPECRTEFQERPSLMKIRKLCNIVEHFTSTQQQERKPDLIYCSYCIDFPMVAVKTCLLCEASLCDNHMKIHSKSVEHVLIEPTGSLDYMKCSIHKEVLKYYCSEDNVSICTSCCLLGEHKNHKVELINDAFKSTQEKVKDAIEGIISEKEETQKRIEILERNARDIQMRAEGMKNNVAALFEDIVKQIRIIQEKVVSEIVRQEEKVSVQISGLIQELETTLENYSEDLRYFETLNNMTDPLTLLNECTALYDSQSENNEDEQEDVESNPDLDEVNISLFLQKSLEMFADNLHHMEAAKGFYIPEMADILLDIKTAGSYIDVSEDLKTATNTNTLQPNRQMTIKPFHVLSAGSFSSGKHYWEVQTSGSEDWKVGVSYFESANVFVFASSTWYLCKSGGKLSVFHKDKQIALHDKASISRLGVILDYEAGRLCFYEMSKPIRCLHTLNCTFPAPLYAAFTVKEGHIRIINPKNQIH
ncbi:E3 ubiquitin-protein ligase TRIM62-like [Bombina bombina]|uniref:E3 ubiquitin-protein ligase TRIM62-like n=1 Tax=Bombina bombina TaxID=8345 RepID=UPI00235AA327|nr:E3 ubiquitin-protein ligase TRIM62-like [Bombina bombina]